MIDGHNRNINYLRLSVTDKCNLRCLYCMPEGGCKFKEHSECLTEEEMIAICKVAVKFGVTKIRVTGGEPLVKKNIISIISKIREIDGVKELCLTTNGVYLPKYSKDLINAGIDRVNISLDTMKEDKYKKITRIGNLKDALDGIKVALNAGFKKVKINAVLIGGFNDDEIENFVNLTIANDVDVRFIELMPMFKVFDDSAFIKGDVVLEKVKNWSQLGNEGVTKLYKLDGAKGNFGIITPLSNHFCKECNRMRVTFDGKLKPCLHSSDEISIKGLTIEEMEEKYREAIMKKPKEHDTLDHDNLSSANRNMNMIGG